MSSREVSLSNGRFPAMEGISSIEDLEALARTCTACSLREGCKGVVVSRGSPRAPLMIVGEGPGAAEDEMGVPFVGAAGRLLDEVLRSMKLSPERDIYVTNVVKCRPPSNRLPTPAEAEACLPFLKEQLRLIRPRIIVCLGALATQTLLWPQAKITRVRGSWFDKWHAKVMPTFHPAAALRDPKKKMPLWEDFMRVREEFRKIAGISSK